MKKQDPRYPNPPIEQKIVWGGPEERYEFYGEDGSPLLDYSVCSFKGYGKGRISTDSCGEGDEDNTGYGDGLPSDGGNNGQGDASFTGRGDGCGEGRGRRCRMGNSWGGGVND